MTSSLYTQADKKSGWANVGDLENCVHFKIGVFFYKTSSNAKHRVTAN